MNKSSIIKGSSIAIGTVSAVAAFYNIGTDGSHFGEHHTKDELGEHYVDMYIKNLSSSKKSGLLEKVKNYMVLRRIDSPTGDFFSAAKNYTLGFASSIIHNIDTLACAAIAIGAPILMKKRGTGIKKGVGKINEQVRKISLLKKIPSLPGKESFGLVAAAIATGYLLFDAGRIFISDVLGVGKKGL